MLRARRRRGGARERQRQQTHEQIFEAALAEIAEHGLADAHIREIAKRSGVTRATVYAHFPTKDDFIFEVLERLQDDLVAQLPGRIEGSGAANPLHAYVDASFEASGALDPTVRNELGALLMRGGLGAGLGSTSLIPTLYKYIAAAQERGEARRDVDAADLARQVTNAMVGLLYMDLEDEPERKRLAHQAVDLLTTLPKG